MRPRLRLSLIRPRLRSTPNAPKLPRPKKPPKPRNEPGSHPVFHSLECATRIRGCCLLSPFRHSRQNLAALDWILAKNTACAIVVADQQWLVFTDGWEREMNGIAPCGVFPTHWKTNLNRLKPV